MELEKVKFKGLNVYENIALCVSLILGVVLIAFNLDETIPFYIIGLVFDYCFFKLLILSITFLIKKLCSYIKNRKDLKKES